MKKKVHRTMTERSVRMCHLHSFSFPEIGNRTFWDAVPQDYRDALITNGEKALQEKWPPLYLSDYMEFSKTGNRVHFEDKFFGRICMLNDLILAEGAENQGRFLQKAIDGIWMILEETSWCLPPHNSYQRDTKPFAVPRDAAPVIDLFAAESAATIGLAEAMLRTQLAGISPFISEYVNHELRRRIIDPYLSCHFWWMGDGQSKMLNWTPWITSNVLLTLLTRQEYQTTADEKDQILNKAARSFDYFLDEYGEDGCCDEGAQYFSHAGLMLYTGFALLEKGLDDPSGVRNMMKSGIVRNMAGYILGMHVKGPYYYNFADCSPLAGRRMPGPPGRMMRG